MNETTPAIRPVRQADVLAIHRIYAHAVVHGTANFEIAPPNVTEMARRIEAVTAADYPNLVAEMAGAVAGYAYVNAYRPRPAYRWSVEDSIYIAPEAQRRGVGQALLGRLIAEATAAGYRQMIAVIGDSAQAASIGLHRRNGFTFSGTVHAVGFKHGRWLDGVIMQRALGAGDTTPPDTAA